MKIGALSILMCGALLGGCVNADTRYKSPTGQLVMCSGVGWGIIGSIATMVAYQKCKDFYQGQGWPEVP